MYVAIASPKKLTLLLLSPNEFFFHEMRFDHVIISECFFFLMTASDHCQLSGPWICCGSVARDATWV